ncbi:MAG: type II toxin-antitoxin system Phd/YefM family antitoxin [Clostridiales bacterium]|jgi:PHD/YefM family antitoxin component YafN of YafNO toxin-antitoxin module|nr:type II toxin-antitoxin system Phd/YefM family antitoxin [Clostridiales bacterium]
MPQIRPISELRNTNEISELCHNSSEPVFITKNGYGDLVIMSMETYEHQQGMMEFYKKLSGADTNLTGEEEPEPLSSEEVFRELNEKFGNNLNEQ